MSVSVGTGRPLLRCHLCMALRSCVAKVLWSGSTLDFPENCRHGMSGATLHSSMAMCPLRRLSGNFSLNGWHVHASSCSGRQRRCASLQIVDDIFHRSVFCKHWSGGGCEKWGDVLPVLVNCLFEEAPQIGGEIGVHQWLHKDWLAGLWRLQSSLPKDHFQCLLRGLFVDVGEVACHTAQPEYAGGAGVAS